MLLFVFTFSYTNAQEGYWKTIDDKTGKPRSVVKIYKTKSGHYAGKIVEIFNPSSPNPVCDECPGDKKGKPIQGLVIIWAMEKVKGKAKLVNGRILDPENGNDYACQIWLENDNTLKVKGKHWTGISRTQTWQKTTAP